MKKAGVGLYAPITTETPRQSRDQARLSSAEGEEERTSLLPATAPALRRTHSEERGRMDVAVEENGREMTAAAAFLFFAPAMCDICGTTLVSSKAIDLTNESSCFSIFR